MLSEVPFPAPLWMLLAHAHSWGAPADIVDQLSLAPNTTYRRLTDVLTALDRVTTDPSRPAARRAPTNQPRP
jgi:hypothetical protein